MYNNSNKIMKNMCYITDDEEWKDIPGYENMYQVSTHGRVKSLKSNKIRVQINHHGYRRIGLSKNGNTKIYFVHRLVAQAFVSNPYNYPIVNHKDENKQNNHYTNLEWCDAKYNANYGTAIERCAKANSIPVLCINLGIVYPNCRIAGNYLYINSKCISACCNNIHGYQFRHLTEEELNIYNNSNQEILKLYEGMGIDNYKVLLNKYFGNNTPVLCETLGIVYININKAEEILNISKTLICKCCAGNAISTRGYKFRYLTEDELIEFKNSNQEIYQMYDTIKMTKEDIIRNSFANSIPVLCINLGLIYSSISEAGRILGLSSGDIGACCRGERNHTNGYQFRYLKEEELNIYINSNQEIYQLYEPQPITNRELFKRYFKTSIPVYCITNNTIYPSASKAERILGINHAHITSCCTGNRNHTAGYQFRYLTEEETFNYMRQLGNVNMCNIIK